MGSILGLEVLLLLSFILFELWAGERLDLEKAVPRYPRAGPSIQCQLFHWVQALIFGDLAGTLERYFVPLLLYLGVFVGSFLVRLVLITVDFGTLGGRGVVWFCLVILVGLLLRC